MNKLIFTLAMLWMQWAIIPVAHAESDVLQWDNGGEQQVDVCIYGATSSGIMAAYTAKKEGKSVALIEPSRRIGGLTAGGLGFTDIGKVEIIQGFALDFYSRVGKEYGNNGPVFKFEPKIALKVYEDYLREAGIKVYMERRIVKAKKKEKRIL